MQKLEEMNDSTWGSGKFHKRLVLVAVKAERRNHNGRKARPAFQGVEKND